MKAQIVSQNDWIFTDSRISDFNPVNELCMAFGSRCGAQLLVKDICGALSFFVDSPQGLHVTVEEMKAVCVDENTAPKLMTTRNYEDCRSYVTRRAPFFVYDCITDSVSAATESSRVFYMRIRGLDVLTAGVHPLCIRIADQKDNLVLSLDIRVYPIYIPEPKDGRIQMMNFFSFSLMEKEHEVTPGTPEYVEIFSRYLALALDMGQTHIMLPLPEYIRDKDGKPIDFDFTSVMQIADAALAAGAPYIVGPCVAHWINWDDPDYHLLWDTSVNTGSVEGFLELKKYYRQWYEAAKQKGYLPYLYHSLADEPQIHNTLQYRALAGIFRRFMPGVPIIEAVEAAELGGALDIWVPKGDVFEKQESVFRRLMEQGENFWYYTCAFPAGAYMNRSMDLPAAVSRYILWMVPYYGMNGFLHWGFNFYEGENIWKKACCPHKGELLPAGDAHIVYADGDKVYPSLRLELQREGRDEAEAFYLLKDEMLRKKLIAQAVSSQNTYDASSGVPERIKKCLYEAIVSQNAG